MRQEKKCAQKLIWLLDHALLNVCKFLIVKSVFINLFNILPKMYRTVVVKPSIRPDIRYPALTGYPVSGF
jgi:hypothetical protein